MTTATETRPAVPPLTRPELWLLGAVAVFAAGVGGLGLASSFEAVSTAGARWGFASPWMLPVGIDVAIPVFTAAFLLLIRTDMPLGWVRFVPWALTGVTCWLNVAAGHSLSAKLAHGTMPLLWVVLSEVAAHVYAARIGAVTGRRMEKIRRSRWLLAPLSTFALWRRMTLWEITSYSDALGRERERQLARAELRERHGRRWRSKTPRPERVLLKLGELSPASEDLPPIDPKTPVPPEDEAPKAPRKRTAKAKPKAQRTPTELLAEAREATADWADDAINAEAIRTTLHCSAANSRILRDALLGERADGRRLHPVDDDESDEAAA
ncbi:hypothetical protein SLUN_21205 [Streptomyces lunaelactis]|uniref:DUF2637 domain-containing protein n=1 Tax=Streptomyces lunaelactis TaxID=1535768 RepID=A0A2R4T5D6_9ACTN|nr:DUF2637 domain-containing protein [Streptomyces lunaelactis]AVZ74301.1 hypothetical protein SLUN_21205 [Streptomyces lunaelactis]NUK85736.1 DUF2637 domain-containing protein [Streptomyces lunaelactis]